MKKLMMQLKVISSVLLFLQLGIQCYGQETPAIEKLINLEIELINDSVFVYATNKSDKNQNFVWSEYALFSTKLGGLPKIQFIVNNRNENYSYKINHSDYSCLAEIVELEPNVRIIVQKLNFQFILGELKLKSYDFIYLIYDFNDSPFCKGVFMGELKSNIIHSN